MNYIKKPMVLFSRTASPKLRAFRFVFEKLAAVHDEYMMAEEKDFDFPYWYTERPNVGFLSAAVWRCGGTTLEEFQTERIHARNKTYGRCDLFMRLGDKFSFACEAKHLWLAIAEDTDADCKKIREAIGQASGQCKRLHVEHCLAMCFINPHIRQKTLKKKPNASNEYENKSDELGKRFQGLWKRLAERKDSKSDGCSALIKIEADHQNKVFSPHERRYAGLILVLKEVN